MLVQKRDIKKQLILDIKRSSASNLAIPFILFLTIQLQKNDLNYENDQQFMKELKRKFNFSAWDYTVVPSTHGFRVISKYGKGTLGTSHMFR